MQYHDYGLHYVARTNVRRCPGKAILKLLQDMCRKKGMTVIIITHNSALAPMADRLIKIKNGKVAKMEKNTSPVSVDLIEW